MAHRLGLWRYWMRILSLILRIRWLNRRCCESPLLGILGVMDRRRHVIAVIETLWGFYVAVSTMVGRSLYPRPPLRFVRNLGKCDRHRYELC